MVSWNNDGGLSSSCASICIVTTCAYACVRSTRRSVHNVFFLLIALMFYTPTHLCATPLHHSTVVRFPQQQQQQQQPRYFLSEYSQELLPNERQPDASATGGNTTTSNNNNKLVDEGDEPSASPESEAEASTEAQAPKARDEAGGDSAALSGGVIAAIVIGCVFGIGVCVLLLLAVVFKRCTFPFCDDREDENAYQTFSEWRYDRKFFSFDTPRRSRLSSKRGSASHLRISDSDRQLSQHLQTTATTTTTTTTTVTSSPQPPLPHGGSGRTRLENLAVSTTPPPPPSIIQQLNDRH